MTPSPPVLILQAARHGIDRIDDAMLRLLAARRQLSNLAGRSKRALHQPVHDPQREQQVIDRAQHLAHRLDLPPATASRMIRLLMADARRQQVAHLSSAPDTAHAMNRPQSAVSLDPPRLLRLIPPPKRWKPLLSRLPAPLHARVLERILSHVLTQAKIGSALEDVAGRRLGICVGDLGLEWVFRWQEGCLRVVREMPEASVRGSATDLLLLASRLEDADTLFFQRRLVLTGDTELGLTVRNLLDRMPWESIPLGLRIGLQRSALLARAARAAYQVPSPVVTLSDQRSGERVS